MGQSSKVEIKTLTQNPTILYHASLLSASIRNYNYVFLE